MTGTYTSNPQQDTTPPDASRAETGTPHAHLEIGVTARTDGHFDARIVQDRQLEIAREVWILHAGHLFRPLDSLFTSVEITDDGLVATISEGPLASSLPYRLRRA